MESRRLDDRKAGDQRSVQTNEITRLDGLLDELGNETEAQCEVLREHLESARVYLVGLMPAEYALSLKMAEEVLNCVSDHNLRTRIQAFIRGDFIHGTQSIQEGR
jgi:hypothetical protein